MPPNRDRAEQPFAFISRRKFLGGAAAGAATTIVAPGVLAALSSQTALAKAPQALSSSEFAVLKALVDRLIPADEVGPGAVAANVHVYIDSALGGDYSAALPAYKKNLAAVDAYARTSFGGHLADLSAVHQDAVVTALESGKVPGVVSLVGVPIPAIKFALLPEVQGTFFSVLLQHTHEGMFGDPMYGGNHDFIGWDLIGYPGVNLVVSATDQAVGTAVSLSHISAAHYHGKPARWSLPEHRAPNLSSKTN